MKQVRLSDHASGMAERIRVEREARNAARISAHEACITAKQRRLEDLSRHRIRAWHEGRYLSWLVQGLHFLWVSSGGHPNQPPLEGPTQEEARWAAGRSGEEAVASFLASHLGDDWTLVGGYRNGAGEIDHVLVGPTGLVTIEVKFRNAAVTIQGDRWIADEYDQYGNLVRQGIPMLDGGRQGRSPSRQLNESTDRLVHFLRKTLPDIEAMRVVVLSHERSRLVSVSHPTVIPVVLGRWPLLDMLKLGCRRLEPEERELLIALVRRDHEFHSRRGTPGRRPGASRAA